MILLVVVFGACTRNLAAIEDTYKPDVGRARSRASTIVFVPGIMGAELHDSRDGRVVWGTFFQGDDSDERLLDIALPFAVDRPVSELRDSIVPGGELLVANLDIAGGQIHARGYPGVFEGLIQFLVDKGTHHHHPRALSKKDVIEGRDPIIGFGYDWRRDIASEAQRLHELVVEASEERRRRTGHSRIDIVGHSMGTQLIRWYLRYGTAPVPTDGTLPKLTWAGVRRIERVLLVGAPNAGSAQALEEILNGSQVDPLLPKYPSTVVATFPSAFELMPRPRDRRVVWANTGEPVELYDVEVWENLQWGPFAPDQDQVLRDLMPDAQTRGERLALLRVHMVACLEQAKRFHRALDRPAVPPREVRIHTFAGYAHPTLAILHVAPQTGRVSWAAPEAGDGTVTRSGALGNTRAEPEAPPTVGSHSVHFSDAEHLSMLADPHFLNQALYLLLEAPDPPAP